ncbi:acyl-CoA thioesterase [Stenomitos frigidus]|uniref:1,4-dihydroxy-2-naphthoyl-CoA hydrolase n=1 Tax=Stenomitos frigidus ULC18 TaxID=2107698 RepID=A0A2T1DZP4_9CYAN|nr:thioesterase family protein [Stenomitos frigidus]PSB25921.1 1,4-dihydroxy-2-naphthoyl-CoA hydrolase [Stenomitos frigidus ULC18]
MPFVYQRTVRFSDTDAAGVVYFANVLSICHEAYEASLAATGIDVKVFFGGVAVAIPIAHTSGNFFRPMACGDRLEIHLIPKLLQDSEFEIAYEVFLENQLERSVSNASTRHVCIDPATRKRRSLPAEVSQWLLQWTTRL